MSLYPNPEALAANPPESWRIAKAGRGWVLLLDSTHPEPSEGKGTVGEVFTTKREAEAERDNPESRTRRAYARDARWFAGHTPAGWRSWEECKAEQDRTAARFGTVAPYRKSLEATR